MTKYVIKMVNDDGSDWFLEDRLLEDSRIEEVWVPEAHRSTAKQFDSMTSANIYALECGIKNFEVVPY